jgi:hypothetical protein
MCLPVIERRFRIFGANVRIHDWFLKDLIQLQMQILLTGLVHGDFMRLRILTSREITSDRQSWPPDFDRIVANRTKHTT